MPRKKATAPPKEDQAEPDPQEEEQPAPEQVAASLRPAPRPVKRRTVHIAPERT